MKKNTLIFMTILSSLLAVSAQAHDPEKHMKGAETPNCASMKNMEHSKMDRSDPVMQAMMEKCMDKMHQDEAQALESDKMHHQPKNSETKNPTSHKH